MTGEFVFAQDAAAAVHDGRADMTLLCRSENVTGLRTQNVGWEFPVALLPSSHALAREATVPLADLERDRHAGSHDRPRSLHGHHPRRKSALQRPVYATVATVIPVLFLLTLTIEDC